MKEKFLKILAVLGCLVLSAGVSACGGKGGNDNGGNSSSSEIVNDSSSEVVEDSSEEDSSVEVGDSSEEVVDSSSEEVVESNSEGVVDSSSEEVVESSSEEIVESSSEEEYPEDYYTEGLVFALQDDDTYAVTEYRGTATEVVIPSVYGGKAVTRIGENAFWWGVMTRIVIPDSVTSISKYAFHSCDNLREIIIHDSVTSIACEAFNNCDSLTIYCEAESKPSSWEWYWVTSATPVVWDCNNNDVADDGYIYTIINDVRYALKDGKATVIRQAANIKTANILTTVTYKDVKYDVTSIGNSAFYLRVRLEEIVIPGSVTSIGEKAFYNCSNLTNVVILDGVTSIGKSAFAECNNLKEIVIPDSATCIGEEVFSSCDHVTNVTCPAFAIPYLPKLNLQKVVITSGDRIEDHAFKDSLSLREIVIPDTITWIGLGAFPSGSIQYTIKDGLKYLGNPNNPYLYLAATETNITAAIIESTCKFIGSYAFYSREKLAEIVIPDSVTSIGDFAFDDCYRLTTIVIPDSVTSIGWYAFYRCYNLTIYCEAENQPSGWASNWNPDNRPVVWGYTEE